MEFIRPHRARAEARATTIQGDRHDTKTSARNRRHRSRRAPRRGPRRGAHRLRLAGRTSPAPSPVTSSRPPRRPSRQARPRPRPGTRAWPTKARERRRGGIPPARVSREAISLGGGRRPIRVRFGKGPGVPGWEGRQGLVGLGRPEPGALSEDAVPELVQLRPDRLRRGGRTTAIAIAHVQAR